MRTREVVITIVMIIVIIMNYKKDRMTDWKTESHWLEEVTGLVYMAKWLYWKWQALHEKQFKATLRSKYKT